MILILFDNGGTLINDPFATILEGLHRSWGATEMSPLARYFTSQTFTAFLELWKRENEVIDFPLASHFFQEERWIIGALRKVSGIDLNHDEIPVISPYILAMYRARLSAVIKAQPQLPAIRSAIMALNAMNSVCVAVASNDRDFATRAMLKWAKLDAFVDAIVTSEMLSVNNNIIEKPDPLFFHRAEEIIARRLAIDTFDKKIYIGDNEENDIVVPNALGYLTVRFFNRENLPENLWLSNSMRTAATTSYRSPTELLQALRAVVCS
jgi:FMN phosphatase YigB (HAD superfamily)